MTKGEVKIIREKDTKSIDNNKQQENKQKRRKINIEYLHNLAKQRGGKCLSKEYTQQYTKYKWQCKMKHEWETNARNILKGYWCPKCSARQSQD